MKMKITDRLGFGLSVPFENFTLTYNYSTVEGTVHADELNSTSDSWDDKVPTHAQYPLWDNATDHLQQSGTYEISQIIADHPEGRPSLLGPTLLFSTFTAPWSRLLTSVIFLFALLLLALLLFFMILLLLVAFKRIWSFSLSRDSPSRKDHHLMAPISLPYPTTMAPTWAISPPPPPPPALLGPYSSTATKSYRSSPSSSSTTFYPAKCSEIAAIAKWSKSLESEPTEHIYMAIDSRGQAHEVVPPLPSPRTLKQSSLRPAPTTSCYITSLEDDATHADEVAKRREETVYGQVTSPRYYAVSVPWYHPSQLHQQQRILQQRVLPNFSAANLQTAKASLKSANYPLSPTLSVVDPATAMMDCYSSYSEVVLELKSKFNHEEKGNKQ